MITSLRSVSVFLFCIFTSVYVPGLQGDQAAVLFQAATHKELVEGDLDGAVQIYQTILDRYGSDRTVAAEALVRLGACYEKLGMDEAQVSYRRVIEDYSDQPGQVRKAQERLRLHKGEEADRPSQPPPTPRYQPVLHEGLRARPFRGFAAQFDFSPDGSEFVFVSSGEGRPLKLSDNTGTLIRSFQADFGEWSGFSLPRWSPDGQSIAYVAGRDYDREEPEQAVFLLSPKGGRPRQLGTVFPGLGLQDLCWAPDGQRLTYLHVNGQNLIGSLIAATGEKEVLERLPSEPGLRFGEYSPDGRWLSCTIGNHRSQRRSDIWILPGGGGRALQLTDSPGFDGHPCWSPDGEYLYFVSERGGEHNLWKLALNPRTGRREGKPKQITFFKDTTVRHPRLIGEGDQMAFLLQRNVLEIWVGKGEDPSAATLVARGKHARISPDGKVLYYVAEGPNRAAGIFALSIEQNTSEHLTQQDPLSEIDLSWDGSALVYHAKDSDGLGVYTLPTGGGQPQLRVRLPDSRILWTPRWSPDGTQLAYTQNGGLFVLSVDDGQSTRLASLYKWEGFEWSPDGTQIATLAYARPDEEVTEPGVWNNAVFVVEVSEGSLRRLTALEEDGYKENLTWHPSGEHLTYVRYINRQADTEIRLAYPDGRPSRLMINQADSWDYWGSWSPDGRKFFFLGTGGLNIFDWSTSEIKRRPFSPSPPPRWSRDGTTAVWTTERAMTQLWLMENFQ